MFHPVFKVLDEPDSKQHKGRGDTYSLPTLCMGTESLDQPYLRNHDRYWDLVAVADLLTVYVVSRGNFAWRAVPVLAAVPS